nr:hypothetical protein [Desulfobulbus propionicus]
MMTLVCGAFFLFHRLQHPESIHARHDQIGDHHVKILPGDRADGLGAVINGGDREVFHLQFPDKGFADHFLVVNKQNGCFRHGPSLSNSCLPARWTVRFPRRIRHGIGFPPAAKR